MRNTRPSLLTVLLQAAANWAAPRDGAQKPSARADRRRRTRQRLKDRAVLCDAYAGAALSLSAQVEWLQRVVSDLNAERHGMLRRVDGLEWAVNDLLQRNIELMGLCATHQHHAEHWRHLAQVDDDAVENNSKLFMH